MDTSDQLNGLIEGQERALRWYLVHAISLFILGLFALATVFLAGRMLWSEIVKSMLGLGSGLVMSVSVFPLKELHLARDRLSIYRKLQSNLRAFPGDKEKTDILVWDVIRKTTIG
jgi:hypothetical protein